MSTLSSPAQKEKTVNIKINNKLQAFEILSLSEGLVLNVSDGQFIIQQNDGRLEIINLDEDRMVYSSDPNWSSKTSREKPSKSFEEFVLNGIGPVYKKSEDCFD